MQIVDVGLCSSICRFSITFWSHHFSPNSLYSWASALRMIRWIPGSPESRSMRATVNVLWHPGLEGLFWAQHDAVPKLHNSDILTRFWRVRLAVFGVLFCFDVKILVCSSNPTATKLLYCEKVIREEVGWDASAWMELSNRWHLQNNGCNGVKQLAFEYLYIYIECMSHDMGTWWHSASRVATPQLDVLKA